MTQHPAVSAPTAPGAARADRVIVAIDGPSGAGKSTVARMLAQRLDARYLDTGAMYRAVTLRVLEEGLDPGDEVAVGELVQNLSIEPGIDPQKPAIAVDGRDVSAEVRGDAVTRCVSAVSALPVVRARLVQIQRGAIADARAIVVEGRDIGTVVVPDADVKVFLTAAPEARATRRNLELRSSKGPEDTAADLARRDALDSSRTASPLKPAADAVEIDTTSMSAAAAVDAIVELIRAKALGRDA